MLTNFAFFLKRLPSTADLGMRVGLNSGPVTAGVLRGEKARFQLFGDSVNTAAVSTVEFRSSIANGVRLVLRSSPSQLVPLT